MRASALLTLLPLVAASPAAKRTEPAPLYARDVAAHDAGKYIVKFKQRSPIAKIQDALSRIGVDPTHRFEHAFQGFAAKMDPKAVEILRFMPDVSHSLHPIVLSYSPLTYSRSSTLSRT